jgi:hypothetical protein
MKSNNVILEAKFEKGLSGNHTPGGQPTHAHPVSTYRTGPLSNKGSSSSDEGGFIQRDTKFHFPRSDCPGFNGSNPVKWVRKCVYP